MQSLDIQNRSATTTSAPQVRHAADPVAKLIDISKCIGCKACQVACMQWNDLRDEIGTNVGVEALTIGGSMSEVITNTLSAF